MAGLLKRDPCPETPETHVPRHHTKRMKGLEPSTICMASRRSSQLSYIRGTASIDRRPRLREGVCAGAAARRADPGRRPACG